MAGEPSVTGWEADALEHAGMTGRRCWEEMVYSLRPASRTLIVLVSQATSSDTRITASMSVVHNESPVVCCPVLSCPVLTTSTATSE